MAVQKVDIVLHGVIENVYVVPLLSGGGGKVTCSEIGNKRWKGASNKRIKCESFDIVA
jgi:hypothetical protein